MYILSAYILLALVCGRKERQLTLTYGRGRFPQCCCQQDGDPSEVTVQQSAATAIGRQAINYAPLLRVRLRARARVRPRRRAGSVRGHGARCLGRRLVVAGRALYRAAVRRDRVCSVVRTGDLSRRHQHGRERAGAQDLRRLRSHLCSWTCFESTRIFRFWLRSAKKGCHRDKQIFCH